MLRCIYCKVVKQNSSFSREHVFPQSFGKYGTQTWTLTDLVCSDCNQRFGDTIDREPSRSTLEGVTRHKFIQAGRRDRDIEYGQKQNFIITEAGALKGLKCRLIHFSNEQEPTLIPEGDIGFRNGEGIYDFYRKDNIPTKTILEQDYPPHEDRVLVIHEAEETVIELKKILGDQVYFKVYPVGSKVYLIS